MYARVTILLVSTALVCGGCGGPIVEAVDGAGIEKDAGDAAPQRYYLPKGVMKVTISYKDDSGFSLAYDKSAVADLSQEYYLRFRHDSLGKETAIIQVDPETQLLQTVAGNGVQQYKELLDAGNAIIQGALNVKNAQPEEKAAHAVAAHPCDGVQAVLSFDIKQDAKWVKAKSVPLQYIKGCDLWGSVQVLRESNPFASSGASSTGNANRGSVYFRIPATYVMTFDFGLSGSKGVSASVPKFPVTVSAPDMEVVGRLTLPRGVFASRGITATFANGMLAKQDVSRDSELVGFLVIPAAGLATAALVKQF